nr:MAG TPA: hypothetical protein [Caudoviricetes sp.]
MPLSRKNQRLLRQSLWPCNIRSHQAAEIDVCLLVKVEILAHLCPS